MVCLDTAGNVWFGTVNGAIRYDPGCDERNDSPPNIHITGISLFFDKIENTLYAGKLTKWSHLPVGLVLPNSKNHLSFEFIGIDFKDPQAVRYKWKLEGYDKEWSPEVTKREATFSNLSPGNYTFMVKACNENGIWNNQPAEFSFTITPPFWAHLWFQGILIVMIVIIGWLIISTRLRRAKHQNQADKQRLEMEKNILELEQATARLQMNPHFIFNSLNSIQGFIANNDKIQAKWYLSKFAKLMRLILDNTREELIPLKDEIAILESYLELEKLRTNNKFDFHLTVNEIIDTETIEIPPMIVQPFVENAVLHGIKQKSGKGNITIQFTLMNHHLYCEITDDGIGRNKARELKAISSAAHTSSAIMITTERLQQLGKKNNSEASIKMIDLKDENCLASGTKIILQIPI
jgi:hypothetical protein